MKKIGSCFLFLFMLCLQVVFAQHEKLSSHMEYVNGQGLDQAKPWVFWYWMHSAYSKEGITADLEAMKEIGISGAYLAPIKGKTDPRSEERRVGKECR